MEEENPLLQMPRPLIDAFFQLAEEHATSTVKRIREAEKRIHSIAKFIQPKSVTPTKASITVATVDGSKSPKSSDRLGTRVAVLSAGYKIFKDEALIKEQFYGQAISEGLFEGRIFTALTNLKMLGMERLAALEALEKGNPDLLIIDGPFLSSLYPLSLVIQRYAHEASKLVASVANATLKLIDSNKAIGIIKRSALRAIDGWLLVRGDKDFLTNTKDKHILTRLMPPSSYWAYEWLMDDPFAHSRALFWARVKELKGKDAFNYAKANFERGQKRFGIEPLPKLKRGYIRFSSETPPFEVELPANMSIEEIAKKIIPLCNTATGLPFPLDLLDADISLDKRVAKAFADEVEARVLNAENPKAVKDYFTGINPQKEE
ncbi:MAG: DNA double-strand break repair nuclease NurA [Nitrososphaerales archaeon]